MNKKRILLVDDEVSFTRLLKLNLEQTNDYMVRVENWPEDAVAAARDFRPHVVLLDVVMPRMIGGDVAARLRADPALRSTPIVFLSALVGRTWVQEHDGMVGGYPFIAKPASVEEVIERIEEQLTPDPSWSHRDLDRRSDSPLPDYGNGHLVTGSKQRPNDCGVSALN
jgi:CheY-like chemotaxis protein